VGKLLQFNEKGIYCQKADVYIDPWKPVRRALITHGHADHSRWGHRYYLCTHYAKPVIKYRLGSHINLQSVSYGEEVLINGVRFSFHPAGHIIGSAQIRVEYKGEVWVVSGDYKLENDGLSTPFEPVKCHTFITESTFGLPVFRWKPQEMVMKQINDWWQKNQEEGKVSILAAYALGKAQRLLAHLDTSIGGIYTHGAIENVNQVLRTQKVKLPETTRISNKHKKQDFAGQMVIATPAALGSSWMKRFPSYSTGIASGWMAMRGTRRRRAADRGFVLSDHADWDGLNQAIKDCGAENIYVTHGYTAIFSNWLKEQGYQAWEVSTQYEGETSDETNQ
jgi:putative mRNA 3-end processing factor